MKLKAGMKVKIIENWRGDEEYQKNDYTEEELNEDEFALPEDLCGIPVEKIDTTTTYKVASVDTDVWNGRYYVKLEDNPFSWPASVFVVVQED